MGIVATIDFVQLTAALQEHAYRYPFFSDGGNPGGVPRDRSDAEFVQKKKEILMVRLRLDHRKRENLRIQEGRKESIVADLIFRNADE